MSWRLELEARNIARRAEHGDPLWPAQLCVAAVIGLNVALSEQLTIGPSWLLPAIEGVALAGLILAAPPRIPARAPRHRAAALSIVAFISLVNAVSLGLLVHYLIGGGQTNGERLIQSGAALWVTNVLLFGVWYWELDGGGPGRRHAVGTGLRDFQFPQSENPELAPRAWRAGFGDYLYTSLTNATAFSPTDTMPLTHTAKLLMALQATTAFLTIGLVISRAVNILA